MSFLFNIATKFVLVIILVFSMSIQAGYAIYSKELSYSSLERKEPSNKNLKSDFDKGLEEVDLNLKEVLEKMLETSFDLELLCTLVKKKRVLQYHILFISYLVIKNISPPPELY